MAKNVSNNTSNVAVQAVKSVASVTAPSFSILRSSVAPDTSTESEGSGPRYEGSGPRITQLSFASEIDEILKARALSNNLPEIVTLSGFLPTASERGIDTLASLMLNLQVSLKNLLKEDNEILISQLASDENFMSAIEDLIADYQNISSATQDDIWTMSSILQKINAMKNVLNLLESTSFETEFGAARSSRIAFSGADVRVKNTLTTLNQPNSIASVLVEHLGFDKDNVAKFSNTRALAQIIYDLYSALIDFTPQLLGAYNDSRLQDHDPVSINRNRPSDEDFSFTSGLFSAEEGFDPTEPASFEDFQSSLPMSVDGYVNRIRVLLTALSREYRISKGLGGLAATGNTYDDPIAEIVGNPGEKISSTDAADGSLASILHLSDIDDIVLPFETRQIRQDQTLFIPGSVYLVDNILRGESSFLTLPLSTFANSTTQVTEDTLSIVDGMMNYADDEKTMFFETVFDSILTFISDSVSTLGSYQLTNNAQALGAALMVACQSDPDLKFALYNYFLSVYSGSIVAIEVTDLLDEVSEEYGAEESLSIQKLGASVLEKATASSPSLSGQFSSYTPAKESSAIGARSGVLSRAATTALGGGALSPKYTSDSSIITGTATTASGLELILGPNVSTTELSSRIRSVISAASETTYANSLTISYEDARDILGMPHSHEDFIFTKMKDYAEQNLSLILHESSNSAYNKLTYQTVLLFLFEIVTSFFAEYVEVNFTEVSDQSSEYVIGYNFSSIASNLGVYVDVGAHASVARTITSSRQFHRDGTHTTEYEFNPVDEDTQISEVFDSLRSSLVLEDEIIQDLIDTVRAVVSSIQKTADSVVNYFDLDSTSTASGFEIFFETEAMRETLRAISDLQVTNALHAYTILFSSDDGLTIPDNQFLTPSQVNALQSMLTEPEYQSPSGDNLRVMAVGMPSGLHNALSTPEYEVGSGAEIRLTSTKLVTINVHRTDLEYSDLIFKPKSFVFDVSSFVENASSALESEVLFSKLLSDYMSYRTFSPASGVSSTKTSSFLGSLPQFDDLDDEEIESVFKNHAVSELLRRYLQLMTGMDLSEYTFLHDESQLNVPFSSSAQAFFEAWVAAGGPKTCSASTFMVGEVAAVNEAGIQDALKAIQSKFTPRVATIESNVDTGSVVQGPWTTDTGSTACEETGDGTESESSDGEAEASEATTWTDELNQETLSRLKRLITSSFFSKDLQRARIMQPKLFERILLIPVDSDDFEIDVSEMQGTDLWNNEGFQSRIITEVSQVGDTELTTYKLESSGIEFAEMYVIVELGGQFE